MSNNNGILIIIAVILLGIFGILFMQQHEKSPGDKMADAVSDVADDVGDVIDGH